MKVSKQTIIDCKEPIIVTCKQHKMGTIMKLNTGMIGLICGLPEDDEYAGQGYVTYILYGQDNFTPKALDILPTLQTI